jgi:cytochrome P450 PksS
MNLFRSRERDLNLADREIRQNPYPLYAQLRREDPVALVRVPFFGATYFISRYDDVAAAFKDPRISTDLANASQDMWAPSWMVPRSLTIMGENMLTKDDPEHRRLRNLVHKAFTPKRIRDMAGRVETVAHELLDAAEKKETSDLVADYALPIPLVIISEMLDVPEEDRHPFHDLTAKFLASTSSGVLQMLTQMGTANKMIKFFERLIADRRANPGDDLLSALIAAEEEGDRLSEEELIGMVFLLLLAGHETTVNLIASGALALLEFPDELDRLRENPELMDSAIEELVRFTNPVELSTPRFALEEIEWHGVTIPQGHRILVGVGSANRDETVFENPDAIDITRHPNKHLGFGLGIHYCLGAPLARMEGKIALQALIDRFPDMRLAQRPEDLTWRKSTLVRGLEALPIHLN